MELLETILSILKREFNREYIDPNCFPTGDLEIIKSEDLSKIPAIHACLDDDFIWIGQDMDETNDDYECYDTVTLPEQYNSINIYLYNLA